MCLFRFAGPLRNTFRSAKNGRLNVAATRGVARNAGLVRGEGPFEEAFPRRLVFALGWSGLVV